MMSVIEIWRRDRQPFSGMILGMVYTDSQLERTRLERVYGDMTEGELRSMAGDASSLTSEAVQALRAETSRRGLDIPVSRQPRRKPSETEFTTRHGIIMLGIFTGISVALILLVLSYPQWFSGCVRGLHLRQW